MIIKTGGRSEKGLCFQKSLPLEIANNYESGDLLDWQAEKHLPKTILEYELYSDIPFASIYQPNRYKGKSMGINTLGFPEALYLEKLEPSVLYRDVIKSTTSIKNIPGTYGVYLKMFEGVIGKTKEAVDSINKQKEIIIKGDEVDNPMICKEIFWEYRDKPNLESVAKKESEKRFEPSRTLLDYLITYSATPDEIPENINYKQMKLVFTDQIEGYFSFLARKGGRLNQKTFVIAHNNQFNQDVGLELISRLYLNIYKAGTPLKRLYKELHVFLKKPRKRHWGELNIVNGDLALIIDLKKAKEFPKSE